jgi:hypothetical protein
MRYTTEITINLPRARVIELFDNPDNMQKWQPGLQSFTPLSGEPGQPGAKSKLVYQMGRRQIEMIETIETRNLPDEFSGTYTSDGVFNRLVNRFYEEGPDKTRWVLENEFQFGGFMKVIGFLTPWAFRRQTRNMMKDFKSFAENA